MPGGEEALNLNIVYRPEHRPLVIPSKDTSAFFNDIEHVGLDMDDLTVWHDPKHLFWNVAEAVLYAKRPDRIIPGRYKEVVRDPHAQTNYIKELGGIAAEVFPLASIPLSHVPQVSPRTFFFQTVNKWVSGTVNPAERTKIAVEGFEFETEDAFWRAYRTYNDLAQREGSNYIKFTPGAREFLLFLFDLRAQGNLQGIHFISNSARERLMERVSFIYAQGIPEVDTITSAKTDIGKRKPEPDALKYVANTVHMSREETGEVKAFYLGNGFEDYLAAVGAGWIPVIINMQPRLIPVPEGFYFRFKDLRAFQNHWQQRIVP